MARNKESLIPKNFKTHFELVPNLALKDALIFIPSIITDVLVYFFLPLSPVFLFIFIVISLFIPFCLNFIRPVKNSIPGWKHIYWAIKFEKKQKVYYFRKVGVNREDEKGI